MNDQYLGDGVYASYDGYQIWLDLRHEDVLTRIALEPEVFKALLAYAKTIGFIKAEEKES